MPKKPEKPSGSGSSSSGTRRHFHTTLDANLVMEAQIRCLQETCSLNDIIEKLLRLWLDGKVKIA